MQIIELNSSLCEFNYDNLYFSSHLASQRVGNCRLLSQQRSWRWISMNLNFVFLPTIAAGEQSEGTWFLSETCRGLHWMTSAMTRHKHLNFPKFVEVSDGCKSFNEKSIIQLSRLQSPAPPHTTSFSANTFKSDTRKKIYTKFFESNITFRRKNYFRGVRSILKARGFIVLRFSLRLSVDLLNS